MSVRVVNRCVFFKIQILFPSTSPPFTISTYCKSYPWLKWGDGGIRMPPSQQLGSEWLELRDDHFFSFAARRADKALLNVLKQKQSRTGLEQTA